MINEIRDESTYEESSRSCSVCEEDDAIPCTGCIKVLTKDQEHLLDLIEEIPNAQLRKTVLTKLRDTLEGQTSR